MRRSIVTGLTVLSLGLSTMVGALVAPTAVSADPTFASDVAELCRELDAAGVLEAAGVTLGECVNIIRGPASEQSNNFVAGFCGLDVVLAITGTTNKGECIKIVRTLV